MIIQSVEQALPVDGMAEPKHYEVAHGTVAEHLHCTSQG